MFSIISRALYPRRCPCCRGVIAADMLICDDCTDSFRKIAPPWCLKCGRHVEADEEYCKECLSKEHSYSSGMAVFEYDSRMKRSMSDFKFNGWKENSDYYVSEAVRIHKADICRFAPSILVPVPIHSSKRALRGYNQAELIASGIGSRLQIPVVSDLLVRTKKTKAMKVLDKEGREANLKTAFICDLNRYSKNEIEKNFPKVMLVDDIYTTGATMEGCTRALLTAGVGKVAIFSIAAGGGS